jgi:hypothetical protein
VSATPDRFPMRRIRGSVWYLVNYRLQSWLVQNS